jgi:hypothetical protein
VFFYIYIPVLFLGGPTVAIPIYGIFDAQLITSSSNENDEVPGNTAVTCDADAATINVAEQVTDACIYLLDFNR